MFATSQEFPTTILNFDLCDRTSVKLDLAWSDQLEYPTNTYFTLLSSRDDLNEKTACFDWFTHSSKILDITKKTLRSSKKTIKLLSNS